MIKDIVVNLSLGERDPAGDYAVSAAEAFDAHVLGVAFAYEPVIPGTVMGGIPPDFIEAQRAESEKKARAAAARFEANAKRPTGSATWRGVSTSPSSASRSARKACRRKWSTKACCSRADAP
jgi:hypothetical protein